MRPKVANIAKWSHVRGASHLQPGSRACLRALEDFGFLMLKYVFSHILETLFLSFLTASSTPKTDKNSIVRYFYTLHPFFNLHEKVMALIV